MPIHVRSGDLGPRLRGVTLVVREVLATGVIPAEAGIHVTWRIASPPHASHEIGDGGADLVGAVFLEEVQAGDGEFGLLGQVRQTSRWRPTRMEPGSALTKSFGIGLPASHAE